MKALSLRQPWAHAVLHLGKHVENRRWSTRFRGEFLIHAAKGMTRDEFLDAVDFCNHALGRMTAARDILTTGEMPQPGRIVRGGIVGVARLVDVIAPCGSADGSLFSARPCAHLWHMPEQYGFVLADVRPTTFVPLRGELGFFEVPPDVVAQALGGAR